MNPFIYMLKTDEQNWKHLANIKESYVFDITTSDIHTAVHSHESTCQSIMVMVLAL